MTNVAPLHGSLFMIKHPLENDYPQFVGIDEAGRGPMAGPLVVAGVIFEPGYYHPELDDSKKLTEKKREELFEIIQKDAAWFSMVTVDEKTIDEKNIYKATQDAMKEIAISASVNLVFTDAMKLPGIDKEVHDIVKGDQKSISIAAASILAKVTRDRYMIELDKKYPQYGFAKHKGYPTKEHKEALKQYGVLDCHRKSYKPVKEALEITLF